MSSATPSQRTGREPATVRIAMWSARHRWPVAALWFVATIGLLAVSLPMGGINASDANANPNEQKLGVERRAYDVFNAGGTNDPYEQVLVVVGGAPGATTDPAFQATVADLVARLGASNAPLDGVTTPTFGQLVDPFKAPAAAGLVSADGSTVRIVGADRRRQGAGHTTDRAGPADPRDDPRREPDAHHPRHQQHVHQRRHQRAHLEGPRFVPVARRSR